MPSPIKRSAELTPLSHDHHTTLVFALRLKNGLAAAVDSSVLQQYVSWYFTGHMLQHFREEEELLFKRSDLPECVRAMEEHVAIHALANDFIATANRQAAEDFHQLVTAHVRFEERELFPLLEKTLPAYVLKYAGTKLAVSHHDACMGNFSPAFWTAN